MATQAERVPVSHIGSLVRPPALIEFLEKEQRNQPYDRAAYDSCLSESVAEAVCLQAEAGIDIVSDGEYGKSINWAFYVHNRLTGVERQEMTPEEAADPMSYTLGGRDREAFPEFYAEYDGRVMQVASAPIRPVVTGPISYSGHAELQRDIANLKSAIAAAGDVEGFLPVVAPASALPNARDEHYGDEESLLFALADALHEEYAAIVDAGLHLQVDDAFLPYMHERLVPPMSLAEYRAGRSCASRRLTGRCADCPRTGRATTSAGEAGTARTCSTCR